MTVSRCDTIQRPTLSRPTLSRRGLLGTLFCAAAAPAIVRASSLMAIKPVLPTVWLWPELRFPWPERWVLVATDNGHFKYVAERTNEPLADYIARTAPP